MSATDEDLITDLINEWGKAVQARDLDGAIARHTDDMLMYDVPALELRGIDEYRDSWPGFFEALGDNGIWDIGEIEVRAGDTVAFATAIVHCVATGPGGEHQDLQVRLTVGLKKVDGQWTVAHEHHSLVSD
jgi:uncharacterized protein (TIGR02246 family)